MASRRKSAPSRAPWIIGGVVVLLAITGAGLLNWKASADKVAATARAQKQWAIVRPAIVARLNQSGPIELGAVWARHTGQICGLVNGKSSFGGLTGMTPFFTEGGRVVFSFDQDATIFGRTWLDCSGDSWIPLVGGTTTEGFCGTKLGQSKCFMASHAQP